MANSMEFSDEYREQVQLLSGGQIQLRLVCPDDKQHMVKAFEHLSLGSRYMRFFGAKSALSEGELRYFTEIDQYNHFALSAMELDDCGKEIGGAGIASLTAADTYEKNIELGTADSKLNHMNDPFVTPTKITPVTNPSTWPKFQNRAPVDRSPSDKPSKLITMGTGTPTASTYRFGPAMALIVNNVPYFVDCGEGWWRAINRSTLTQGGIDLTNILTVQSAKYMFLTRLHEDHTVGLLSFILSPYKFGSKTDKVIFGPPGTEALINGIVQGWKLDRQEMIQGSTHQSPQGNSATVGEVDFDTRAPGPIFEDDNVKVEAFPTKHGSLAHTLAFRFTTKPDGRVIAFGGDGHYSKGLVEAAKNADILVIEGITRKNIKYASWGGDTVEEKVKTISAYHMFPSDMQKVQKDSGVKTIVMVHEQNFNSPEKFSRLGLRDEMREAGVKNIYSAIDGDMF